MRWGTLNRSQKRIQILLWILIFLLGLYILYRGLIIADESGLLRRIPVLSEIQKKIESMAVDVYMPGIQYQEETSQDKTWLDYVMEEISPLYVYSQQAAGSQPDIESKLEYELLVAAEQALETETEPSTEATETQTETQTEAQTETQTETEKVTEKETEVPTEATTEAAQAAAREPVQEVPREQLNDFDYILNRFYAVDPTTTADSEQLNADKLLSDDMTMKQDNSKPQILIYHTHSQEAFVDSVEGDVNTTIVGVGERLAQILRDTYDYNVIHHTAVYDMIDGQLDRNRAYTLAAPDVQQILDENPSIEVVIDLHRDGVDGTHFVKEINGKPTAQIMFFNGLSRTARNGPIDYLQNPYIDDNLAFSFQLALKAEEYYPEWMRFIYLQSLRYNLHLRPKALLVESGTQLNTVEEQMNAMEPLADILNQVLRGQ